MVYGQSLEQKGDQQGQSPEQKLCKRVKPGARFHWQLQGN